MISYSCAIINTIPYKLSIMDGAFEFLTAFASLNLTAILCTAQIVTCESIASNVACIAMAAAIPAVATFISNEMMLYDEVNKHRLIAIGYVAAIGDRTPIQLKKLALRYISSLGGIGTHSGDVDNYVLSKAIKVGILATKTRSFQRLLEHRRSQHASARNLLGLNELNH